MQKSYAKLKSRCTRFSLHSALCDAVCSCRVVWRSNTSPQSKWCNTSVHIGVAASGPFLQACARARDLRGVNLPQLLEWACTNSNSSGTAVASTRQFAAPRCLLLHMTHVQADRFLPLGVERQTMRCVCRIRWQHRYCKSLLCWTTVATTAATTASAAKCLASTCFPSSE